MPLNWIVPMRRAVVCEESPYATVLSQWKVSLIEGHDSLARWYGFAAEGRHENGLRWLASVIQIMRAGTAAAARPASIEQGNTLDVVPPAHVRLWKGPKRILHHAAVTEEEIGYDLERREVRAPGALFFPGDLIEFPLHRFLAACLGDDSSDARALWAMQFHGNGHPSLGNTVLTGEGNLPTGDLALHDNILAARFQMILSLALCGWSSPTPVYQNSRYSGDDPASWGLLGRWESQRVYARGMMYAGSFSSKGDIRQGARRGTEDAAVPTYVTEPEHTHYWEYGTLHWGKPPANGRLKCAPSIDAVDDNLRLDQPLTPGWACSPCTLALTYLLRNAPRSAANGVSRNFPSTRAEGGLRFVERQAIVDAGTPPAPEPEGVTPRRTRAPVAPDRIPVTLLWADQRENLWGGPVGDVNVAALGRHEQGFVKLFPGARLLASEQKPFIGHLTAYNPVTGEDYFAAAPDSAEYVDAGQLYLFEATGSLVTVPGAPTIFGSRYFNWEPIVHNTVYLKRSENTQLHGIMYDDPGEGDRRRPTQRFNRFICMDLNQETVGNEYAFGRAYRPIVIADANTRIAMTRNGNQDDYKSLYAERAVPYWTMAEFVTYAGYPLLSAIAEAVTTANQASAAAAAQREAARHPVSETEVGGDGVGAGGS